MLNVFSFEILSNERVLASELPELEVGCFLTNFDHTIISMATARTAVIKLHDERNYSLQKTKKDFFLVNLLNSCKKSTMFSY